MVTRQSSGTYLSTACVSIHIEQLYRTDSKAKVNGDECSWCYVYLVGVGVGVVLLWNEAGCNADSTCNPCVHMSSANIHTCSEGVHDVRM